MVSYLDGLTSTGRSPQSLPDVLRDRRQRLAERITHPVVLWSGQRPPRNFPANGYPFRASSHFLYFAGLPLERAAIILQGGNITLFWDEPPPSAALWHGTPPSRQDWAETMGADAAYPYRQLANYMADHLATHGGKFLSLPVQDAVTDAQQQDCLGRSLAVDGVDADLVAAMIDLRLQHDGAAIAQIEAAVAVTLAAHRAGMAATGTAQTEAAVRGAMEQVILAANMTCAYGSIVTVQGDVLHNEVYHHALSPGALLLADVGAEATTGWASDVTRTWPVSGRFSSTQRDIYDVVLAAHDACIAALAPGVEYRDIHLLGTRAIATGLVDLGILQGSVDALIEHHIPALFFPHGIGHLLGLDVHDMEDLGDRAGYDPGRQRSDRPGLCYLRLDRPLRPGMVVTIEPGFYQVPALLQDEDRRSQAAGWVNWERLAQFADVRGIRIEDDVLITPSGHRVLTADLPTAATAIEALVQG
jgi:Xaa-Pro aminopeptidase